MGSIIGAIFFHLHHGEKIELNPTDIQGFTCDYCQRERADFNSCTPNVLLKCFTLAKSFGLATNEDEDSQPISATDLFCDLEQKVCVLAVTPQYKELTVPSSKGGCGAKSIEEQGPLTMIPKIIEMDSNI